MTDQEIIRGFLKGSKREYAEVLGWISAVVHARIWVNRVAPEDAIADTRLKLLLNFRQNTFRLESSLKTYVQRITLYTLVDTIRRQKKYAPLDTEGIPADTTNPHSQLESDEQLALLERAMAILPDTCQALFRMVLQEKIRYKGIASQEGTTEGAIKTRFARCKARLTEIMRLIG